MAGCWGGDHRQFAGIEMDVVPAFRQGLPIAGIVRSESDADNRHRQSADAPDMTTGTGCVFMAVSSG